MRTEILQEHHLGKSNHYRMWLALFSLYIYVSGVRIARGHWPLCYRDSLA